MHFARQKRNHARISRRYAPLEARAPALITLPISMPSIPLLGPLITPLIAGTNKPVTKTSKSKSTYAPAPETTPAPTPTIPPVPTPTTAVNDNGGNDPIDTSRSNDFSTSSFIDVVDGKTTVIDSGAGTTSVKTGGSTSSLPQPSDASGTAHIGGHGSGNGSSGDSALNSHSGLKGSVANVAGIANPTSGTGSNNLGGGLSNGGNADSVTSEATASFVKGSSGSTASPGPDGTTNAANSGSNHIGSPLSGGAIAGVVVVVMLGLIAVIVVLLRGRYRERRSAQRSRWWNRSGTRLSTESESTPSVSRASISSSFETTMDYGQTQRLSISIQSVPSLPPMAEVRGGDNIQLFSPNSAIPDSPMLIAFDNSKVPGENAVNNRTSTHSVASGRSGSHLLAVPNGDDREASSPVSVRPFSPSESFSFPMPPKTQSGDSSTSPPMSIVTLHSGSRSLKGGTAAVPALPSNPFADPSSPFSDSLSPPADFAEVEPIRRPFNGTRHDELTVTIADTVKILRLFDDGWALVEKLPAFEEIIAKQGKNIHRPQGMIPIDCFRPRGEDLSTFISEKRVSSTLYQEHLKSVDTVPAI